MTNEEFEPIRIRIMQEAYELADKNDTEGYNSVKVMCGDVQNLIQREWVSLTKEELQTIFNYEPNDIKHIAFLVESLCKEKNNGG